MWTSTSSPFLRDMVPPHCYDHHQHRSPPAGCFAVSSHMVAFGSIRFCSLLAHGHFWRRSPLYSIPTHGRFWQRPPPPFCSHLVHPFAGFSHTITCGSFRLLQSSRAPLRRPLIHDRLWQLSPFHNLCVHPFAGFSHTTACGSFRLFIGFSHTSLQAPDTRLHVAALAFLQASRAPPRRLLAHDCPWQLSPFRSLLGHPFTGLSHMIAFGSFCPVTVFLYTPSQASRTRSLVAAFTFPQPSWAPFHRVGSVGPGNTLGMWSKNN